MQSVAGSTTDFYKMLFAWMELKGSLPFNSDYRVSCSDLHCGTTCTREFVRKYENVFKNNWLFYMILHTVPFIIFKGKTFKNKNNKERLQMLLKLLKDYCGSILFMGTFVGFLKLAVCLLCRSQGTNYRKLLYYLRLHSISREPRIHLQPVL